MAEFGNKLAPDKLKLFLSGDVMIGRGIDQILPDPSSPEIYESYLTSAEQYIDIAEQVNGPIPRPVDYDYVWGDTLVILRAADPLVRIVNLETAVTTSDDHWPHKSINYRMHPDNLPVLSVAEIDCCVLANNHVLDWGYDGLEETLASLHRMGITTAGAGRDHEHATAPAILEPNGIHRVIVLSMGDTSSGIGEGWSATGGRPGVWLLDDLSMASIDLIGQQIDGVKAGRDIVVASIHWGGNWGYNISARARQFAHDLLDHAGVDLVHGHSSHHPRGIEVHNNKLILYGCGDFINDYEGIPGHDKYRDDLRLMYLPELDPANGDLIAMNMPVLQTHRFRLRNASGADARWLAGELDRESRCLSNTRVELGEEGLRLRWG
jgi:poly-gamma-glutamate synthesis protein (capsule biosynthesis protein)